MIMHILNKCKIQYFSMNWRDIRDDTAYIVDGKLWISSLTATQTRELFSRVGEPTPDFEKRVKQDHSTGSAVVEVKRLNTNEALNFHQSLTDSGKTNRPVMVDYSETAFSKILSLLPRGTGATLEDLLQDWHSITKYRWVLSDSQTDFKITLPLGPAPPVTNQICRVHQPTKDVWASTTDITNSFDVDVEKALTPISDKERYVKREIVNVPPSNLEDSVTRLVMESKLKQPRASIRAYCMSDAGTVVDAALRGATSVTNWVGGLFGRKVPNPEDTMIKFNKVRKALGEPVEVLLTTDGNNVYREHHLCKVEMETLVVYSEGPCRVVCTSTYKTQYSYELLKMLLNKSSGCHNFTELKATVDTNAHIYAKSFSNVSPTQYLDGDWVAGTQELCMMLLADSMLSRHPNISGFVGGRGT